MDDFGVGFLLTSTSKVTNFVYSLKKRFECTVPEIYLAKSNLDWGLDEVHRLAATSQSSPVNNLLSDTMPTDY